MLPRNFPPDLRGRSQAYDHAGPWPLVGTIEEYEAATKRAVKAAHFAFALEYRWNMRFRFWENPAAYEASAPQARRLQERQHEARRIAEDREWELRQLREVVLWFSPHRGSA
jgi:hypothetical protein